MSEKLIAHPFRSVAFWRDDVYANKTNQWQQSIHIIQACNQNNKKKFNLQICSETHRQPNEMKRSSCRKLTHTNLYLGKNERNGTQQIRDVNSEYCAKYSQFDEIRLREKNTLSKLLYTHSS